MGLRLLHQHMIDQQDAALHFLQHPRGRLQPLAKRENVFQERKGGLCCHSPPIISRNSGAQPRPGAISLQSLHARHQPAAAPLLALVMFQTSRNGLGPADGSSRIMPENSTLAM